MAVLAMIFIIVGSIFWPNKAVFIFSIAGVIFLLGAWRFITDFHQNDLSLFYGQNVQVTAVITEEPDVRSDKVYLTLGQAVINSQKVTSKILATVPLFPQYQYGQKIEIQAKIQEPKDFPDFSYKNYLSRFGIDAVAYYPKIKVINNNSGNKLKSLILQIKQKFVMSTDKVLPEPQASFLGGLLLGTRRAIPQEWLDKFNATGTSHMVAISGYNITIIANAMYWLFSGLRKRLAFSLSVLGIVMFVIMTGATASVIRAGIMGGLVLLALNIGRVYAVGNALAFTAAVMLIFNPQILVFDTGFQLSFAALLGIIYFVPVIQPIFRRLPDWINQYLLPTIAAQIFTLPILLLNFGLLSVVAPMTNVLTLPLVPITMLFGFLAGLTGLVWTTLALPFAGMAWLFLTYILKTVDLTSRLPYAAKTVHFSFFFLVIYYLVVALIFINYFYHEQIVNLLKQWKVKLKNS